MTSRILHYLGRSWTGRMTCMESTWWRRCGSEWYVILKIQMEFSFTMLSRRSDINESARWTRRVDSSNMSFYGWFINRFQFKTTGTDMVPGDKNKVTVQSATAAMDAALVRFAIDRHFLKVFLLFSTFFQCIFSVRWILSCRISKKAGTAERLLARGMDGYR